MDTNQEQLSRYERNRREREEKDSARQRRQRNRKIRNYGIVALILLAIIAGVWRLIRQMRTAEVAIQSSLHSQRFDSLGQSHVPSTASSTYNSVPPTSGDHFASQTNWGIHKEEIPIGYQIHNLEHGGILMQYRPDIDTDTLDKLKALGENYDWTKLILAPYSGLDAKIALTAWTYLDTFDDFDEARIRSFIEAYRNKGPENVPDNMASVSLP